MAGSRVEDVPADQFNHTVAALRLPDGSFRFLDPTWSPCSREPWSSREALQGVVPGTPEGEELMLSPHFPPRANRVRAHSEATLDENGRLAATVSMDFSGYPCTAFRRIVNRSPPAERADAIRAGLAIAPNASIARLLHTDPFDYSRDSTLEFDLTAEGFAAGGAVRVFRLPLLAHPLGRWTLSDLLDPPPAGDRKYPLKLRATREIRYAGTVRLPPGWTVTDLPRPVRVAGRAASLEFSARTEGDRIEYTLEFEAHVQTVPAKDVANLREAMAALEDLSEAFAGVRAGKER
jgi:hypothetical protein